MDKTTEQRFIWIIRHTSRPERFFETVHEIAQEQGITYKRCYEDLEQARMVLGLSRRYRNYQSFSAAKTYHMHKQKDFK